MAQPNQSIVEKSVELVVYLVLHAAGVDDDRVKYDEWAHTETLIARLEALVSDAAHRLSELALQAGDHRLAEWSALQGLLASPADEVLYRDRMLAADAAGNLSGVEAAMKELCRVVDGIEPYDTLHPETVRLYERLTADVEEAPDQVITDQPNRSAAMEGSHPALCCLCDVSQSAGYEANRVAQA